jgi:hypothetical protein
MNMAVAVISFKMPDPMEIPDHIVDELRQMPPDEAVKKGAELLLDIDAAETIIYERVDEEGALQLRAVVTRNGQGEALDEQLRQQEFYGKALADEGNSLAGAAFARKSSLLVMGQAEAGEPPPLPAGLARHLLDSSGAGNVGFLYVLTLSGADSRPLGAMTLLRPQSTGPLNHEQPNITEGLRRVLCDILERG